jgi:hypothetical protein
MVNNSIQPKGTNYCDAGNNGAPYCNEIDFLETNGNRIFQQTIHLNKNSHKIIRLEVEIENNNIGLVKPVIISDLVSNKYHK